MIDETDISQERKWYYKERARVVINALQRNNINAQYVSGRREALPVILDMIPPGAVVARADSISLEQPGRGRRRLLLHGGLRLPGSEYTGTCGGARCLRQVLEPAVPAVEDALVPA